MRSNFIFTVFCFLSLQRIQIKPISGLDNTKTWRLIFNNEEYVQTVNVEICSWVEEKIISHDFHVRRGEKLDCILSCPNSLLAIFELPKVRNEFKRKFILRLFFQFLLPYRILDRCTLLTRFLIFYQQREPTVWKLWEWTQRLCNQMLAEVHLSTLGWLRTEWNRIATLWNPIELLLSVDNSERLNGINGQHFRSKKTTMVSSE